jgi:hypothetical protein
LDYDYSPPSPVFAFRGGGPLRQRLDPPETNNQNSVLDALKVRALEEILQLKRNKDWQKQRYLHEVRKI